MTYSVLTLAADTPQIRRSCVRKGLFASAIAALAAVTLAMAGPCAFAADYPVKAPVRAPVAAPPVVAPIPLYNWTGFYIGANIGGAWDRTTITDNLFDVAFSDTRSGFIGGGQIGYNWQLSPVWVVGVEWMFDGTDIRTDDVVVVFPNTIITSAKVDWIQTLAARFGWASNNWLFYGKAGGGWVRDSATLTLNGLISASASDTTGGWLVGLGVEYGITPNWTVRVEWDHIGLGDTTHPGFVVRAPFDVITVSRRFDLLTAGLNYKFTTPFW